MTSRHSGSSPVARAKLLLELGRGGMGTVYLAAARGPAGFRKLKVIKRLRADLAADPRFLQMFLEEARLAARLSHPNVVQTNDVGFDGVHYFIEMEYLEGVSLDVFLKSASKHGGYPLPLALWILTQVLEGLHYAHELTGDDGQPLRIVHRDVSPHNVLLTYVGGVKLLDFGIAKAADSTLDTGTGVVKGKVTYMAPEQATRRPVDRRADVFSAGVIMWQMLTGTRLWSDLSDAEIYVRLEKGELPAPTSVNGDVPEALEAICMRALAKEPAKRHPTAGELQAEIELYLAGCHEQQARRQLANTVQTWFAEARATRKAELDQQLLESEQGEQPRRDPEVPLAGHAQPPVGAPSAEFTKTDTSSGAGHVVTRLEGARDGRPDEASLRRARRRTALLSGASLILVAAGATVFALERGPWRKDSGAGSPSNSAASAPHGCSSNADCTRTMSAPALCRRRDGQCVPLGSEDCEVLAEPDDILDSNTIWLGVMLPPDPYVFATNRRACELARRDFAAVAGGLPPKRPGGRRRPLALVACDDTRQPTRVARHLADDLEVPVIIGFRSGAEALAVIRDELIPRHVLTIVALNTNALITHVPQLASEPRLVWRSTYSNAETAAVAGVVVPGAIEPIIRRRVERPIRVAFVRPNDTTGMAFASRLFSALRFNGQAAVDNGENYREFSFDPASQSDADLVSALVSFSPDIIIHTGVDEVSERIFPAFESQVGRTAQTWYLAGSELGPAAIAFVKQHPETRSRFLGITTASDTEANAEFVMHYNEAFPRDAVTRTFAPNTAYDAVYLAAYSIAAADDGGLTGSDVATGLLRLVGPGPTVDAGPVPILDAFRTLANGSPIHLRGTAGESSWSAANGEAAFDYSVICVDAAAGETKDSGATYSATTGELRGTIACR